jgi:hypothetical protein
MTGAASWDFDGGARFVRASARVRLVVRPPFESSFQRSTRDRNKGARGGNMVSPAVS